MWSLGPHCHSVLRGYRFVDPQWEQDFQLRPGGCWSCWPGGTTVTTVELHAN